MPTKSVYLRPNRVPFDTQHGRCRFIGHGPGATTIEEIDRPLEAVWVRHDSFEGWRFAVEFDYLSRTVGVGMSAAIDPVNNWGNALEHDEAPRALPPGGLTARTLRTVPWAEIETSANHFLRSIRLITASRVGTEIFVMDDDDNVTDHHVPHPGGGPTSVAAKLAGERLRLTKQRAAEGPRRGGRVRQPDLDFATVARTYVEVFNEPGGHRAPVAETAKREHKSGSTVRGMIAEARKRGLLTDAPEPTAGASRGGRAGGELTERARQLLNEGNEQ